MTQGSSISSDGRVVVGIPSSGNGSVFWTRDSGVTAIASAPGTFGGGSANGVSVDGTWIVGSVRVPGGTTFGLAAYRWSKATGMQVLPDQTGGTFPSFYTGHAVSADGNIVAGYGNSGSTLRAFRHNAATGVTVGLNQLPSSSPYSTMARGMSADGSILFGGSTFGNGFIAWRSTAQGMQRLESLNPGTSALPFQENAMDASDDGRFVAGWSVLGPVNELQFRAAMWDGTALNVLGDDVARAYGVNNDGTVVVGSFGTGDSSAMLWTSQHGMVDLQDFLTSTLGLDAQLNGWRLIRAQAVSGDGRVITGWGTQFGQTRGFVAVIPEPGVLVGLAGAAFMLVRRSARV
jgi:hypothetical protein